MKILAQKLWWFERGGRGVGMGERGQTANLCHTAPPVVAFINQKVQPQNIIILSFA